MLKVVYAFFVGILLTIFVGVGISTFYVEPAFPKAQPAFERMAAEPQSAEYKLLEADYSQAQEQFHKDISVYYRNVSIIALIAAVIFVTVGLIFAPHIHILSDGLLLGGVFTLMYSIIRGFMTDENAFRFMLVTAGLVIALVLGYIKFIRPEAKKISRKNK